MLQNLRLVETNPIRCSLVLANVVNLVVLAKTDM